MNISVFNRMLNALPKIKEVEGDSVSLRNFHYEISSNFYRRCENSEIPIINFLGNLHLDERFFQLMINSNINIVRANVQSFQFNMQVNTPATYFYAMNEDYNTKLEFKRELDNKVLRGISSIEKLNYTPSTRLYGNIDFINEGAYRIRLTAHLGKSFSRNNIPQLIDIITEGQAQITQSFG